MKKTLFLIAFSLLALTSTADEGMWLVNAVNRSLELRMRQKGLQMDAKVIYNEDSVALADAVVSLDFGCTGSVISDKGLLITNHHCAYSDLNALSTSERNLLEDGFWAFNAGDEIPIPGKGVQMLHKVIDVTDEYAEVVDSLKGCGMKAGGRKCSFELEHRYNRLFPGYVASLSSFWGGEKYYMAIYREYKDIRLVGAPPVSVAAFGGDVDNWEWPQQKGDFALYRIYTAPDGSPAPYSADNVPLQSAASLKISTHGVHSGDFTLVMGYPGVTDRYASSFEVDRSDEIECPAVASERKAMMDIISKAMDADPLVRLKYSDFYFNLSNAQEMFEDQAVCCRRFDVAGEKRAEEVRLGRPGLLDSLSRYYDGTDSVERQIQFFRETVVRGTRIIHLIFSVSQCYSPHCAADSAIIVSRQPRGADIASEAVSEYDLPLEKELFALALRNFYANVEPSLMGDYLRSEYKKCGFDADSVASSVWRSSVFTDSARFAAALSTPHERAFFEGDPLSMALRSAEMISFNRRRGRDACGMDAFRLEREYERSRYRMLLSEGAEVYPDANSTMRFTYGTVTGVRDRKSVV